MYVHVIALLQSAILKFNIFTRSLDLEYEKFGNNQIPFLLFFVTGQNGNIMKLTSLIENRASVHRLFRVFMVPLSTGEDCLLNLHPYNHIYKNATQVQPGYSFTYMYYLHYFGHFLLYNMCTYVCVFNKLQWRQKLPSPTA